MHYNLAAERATLHGHFSRELAPVLTIDPGDSVSFSCIEAGWDLEAYFGIWEKRTRVEGLDPVLDSGHALTGPVFVRGAMPGMTLAVTIDELVPGSWGRSVAGGFPCEWNDALGVSKEGVFHAWALDREAGTATNQHGHTVKLRPFMGVMGMPADVPGIQSTIPPRATGGNMDCKELVAGTTLYLPIEVEGGLFSVGDGHGVQGDGEVSVTAIEMPVDPVRLTFNVFETSITAPIADTPAGWVAMGFHRDLNQATILALESMLTLMGGLHNLSRLDALALASLCVDMRITQVVNETRGVHAVLPHGAISVSS